MKLDQFADLPDESSLWIYGFESELTDSAEQRIRQRLADFIESWETHGRGVQGVFEVFGKRFVVLAGHCEGGISGCSVDASVRVFKQLREEGLDGLDRSRIYFRTPEGSIRSVHFSKFQDEIDAGRVGAESSVFDTNLVQLGQLRAQGFERPLAQCWHARAFSVPHDAEIR